MLTENVYTQARDRLKDYENCNLKRHPVDGKDHIGWGHYIGQQQTPEEMEILGVQTQEEVGQIQVITQEQADALFKNDIYEAVDEAETLFPEFYTYTETRQVVLISMFFQCGLTGIRKFKKFRAAVAEGNWAVAAVEMLDSLVAKVQSPGRWKEQAYAMEFDRFEWEQDAAKDVGVEDMQEEDPRIPPGVEQEQDAEQELAVGQEFGVFEEDTTDVLLQEDIESMLKRILTEVFEDAVAPMLQQEVDRICGSLGDVAKRLEVIKSPKKVLPGLKRR